MPGDEETHGDRERVDEQRRGHVQRPDRDPREEVDRHLADERPSSTEGDDREHEARPRSTPVPIDADLPLAHVTPVDSTKRSRRAARAVSASRRGPSQPFNSESSSTEVDERRRKTATTMPRPTVTSAAATTITKKTMA